MNNTKPNNTSEQYIVNFHCKQCNAMIQANASRSGHQIQCHVCSHSNRIPLPRLQVGGGLNTHSNQNDQSNLNSSTAENSAAQRAKATNANPKATNSSQATFNDTQTTQAASLTPELQKTENKITIATLFLLCACVGWFSPYISTIIYSTLFVQNKYEVSINKPINRSINTQQLSNILGFWRAAKIANETIETNLNVSLAEMENLGMVDQAAVVRKAISKKKEQIQSVKSRYIETMKQIQDAYQEQPEAITNLFSRFIESTEIQTDPNARRFFDLTIELLTKPHQSTGSYETVFNQSI